MTGPERAIRWSAVAAVAVVAVIAGWVSYVHAYDVIRSHGEAGLVGRVYPGTVDGLIYCASMVLLDSARRGVRAPAIARWLLAAGIGATLFANVAAGLSWGLRGAVVAEPGQPWRWSAPTSCSWRWPGATTSTYQPPYPPHLRTVTAHPKATGRRLRGSPPGSPSGRSQASARSGVRCTSASPRHRRSRRTWPHSRAKIRRYRS